ncbi:MAG: 1-acyl-sn-glycerol-3-phosphate acyltransferase [Firmicutes bacterium]|nr:1-acyl-sn-glycerol-3-phosphate acyltransferase [Bacillota bacterium]
MYKFLQIVKSLIILLIGIVILILSGPVALIALIFQDRDKYAHPPKAAVAFLQFITKLFTRLAGCNYKIEGQENIPDTPAVFVGNHQGDFDAFLSLFAFGEPKATMAKKEIKVVPIANLWMFVLKVIFVDRKDHKKAREAMMESQEYVKNGRSVLYFAEGTRSQGPDMGPFKGGAFKTAVATGTQIVPFAIDGTYKVFEQQGYLKKTDVYLHILPPVPVSTEDDPRELSDKIQGLIQEELDKIRA